MSEMGSDQATTLRAMAEAANQSGDLPIETVVISAIKVESHSLEFLNTLSNREVTADSQNELNVVENTDDKKWICHAYHQVLLIEQEAPEAASWDSAFEWIREARTKKGITQVGVIVNQVTSVERMREALQRLNQSVSQALGVELVYLGYIPVLKEKNLLNWKRRPRESEVYCQLIWKRLNAWVMDSQRNVREFNGSK